MKTTTPALISDAAWRRAVPDGAALAERRKSIGLSQEQLAQACFATRQSVMAWERYPGPSGNLPTQVFRQRLAEVLELDFDDTNDTSEENRQ